MSVDIFRRRIAIDDVDEVAEYLATDDIEVSIRFLEAFERTLKLLGNRPQIGSPCEFWSTTLKGLRRFPIDGFRRYFIFYIIVLNQLILKYSGYWTAQEI